MNLHFQNDDLKSSFFRELSLIHHDLRSYASSAAPYCALNGQADDKYFVEKMNQNATFWNCVLASLLTTAIVSLARLHDKAKRHNHLVSYLKAMKLQNADCRAASQLLETAITNQEPFIEQIVSLRHRLFAHTDFHAPLVAAFGFEGIKVNDFRVYWNELLSAMEACDVAMFGTQEHGPKLEKNLFASIEADTKAALPTQSSPRGLEQ